MIFHIHVKSTLYLSLFAAFNRFSNNAEFFSKYVVIIKEPLHRSMNHLLG